MNTVSLRVLIYKSILALYLLLNFTVNIIGQTNNIEKYWYYRHRLVNGFVKIGNQPGESLVAGIRNQYVDDNINNTNNNIHNHKYLDYGDQTIYSAIVGVITNYVKDYCN